MTILYPLGTGSVWANNELRFSLRSLQCVRDLEGVFVVGSNPEFLSEQVTFIPTYQEFSNPARGIFENVLAACLDKRVPERFCLMNDDYFFCSEVELGNYPYIHLGPITDTLKRCSGEYYHHLFATQQELRKRGLPITNFDSHYPFIIEKEKFLQVAEMYDWNRQHGFTLKSTYCNTLGIEGEFRPDCKTNSPKSLDGWVAYCEEKEVFSIGDAALNGGHFVNFIRQVFPEKSKFEI